MDFPFFQWIQTKIFALNNFLVFFNSAHFSWFKIDQTFIVHSLETRIIQISWNFQATLHGAWVPSFHIFNSVCPRFLYFKNYKMRSVNDRDMLFFEITAKTQTNHCIFLTVHRLKLIPLKNNWKKWPLEGPTLLMN